MLAFLIRLLRLPHMAGDGTEDGRIFYLRTAPGSQVLLREDAVRVLGSELAFGDTFDELSAMWLQEKEASRIAARPGGARRRSEAPAAGMR